MTTAATLTRRVRALNATNTAEAALPRRFGVKNGQLPARTLAVIQAAHPHAGRPGQVGGSAPEAFGLTKMRGPLGKLGLHKGTDPNVRLSVAVHPDRLYVVRLDAVEQGKGHGARALQRLKDYAAATGRHVALTAGADTPELQERLNKFYERQGFKRMNNDAHPDFEWHPAKATDQGTTAGIKAAAPMTHEFYGNQFTTAANRATAQAMETQSEADHAAAAALHRSAAGHHGNSHHHRAVEIHTKSAEFHEAMARHAQSWDRRKQYVAENRPKVDALLKRVLKVVRTSQPGDIAATHKEHFDPRPHDQARDDVERTYQAAALKAAHKLEAKRRNEKRRIDEVMLLLLLASEDAYVQMWNKLGTDTANPDRIMTAMRFAQSRQAQLGGFAQRFEARMQQVELETKADKSLAPAARMRMIESAALAEARMMAATETQVTYGVVQLDRLRLAGFKTARWVTMDDERVRPSHQECEEAGEVELGKPFPNGLLFPGDPAGPPEEVCNCRCYLIGGSR